MKNVPKLEVIIQLWHFTACDIIHLFTGYEDNSKFIVPRDTNYFPTRGGQ